jgi:hypothetical protein
LGTAPDEVIAQRVGRTANAVRIKRERLGIPRPNYRDGHRRWTDEELALLGAADDDAIARQIDRPASAVLSKRHELRIWCRRENG